MAGLLDYFLGGDLNISESQRNAANQAGLINAALAMSNLNAPSAAPAATTSQVLLSGLKGYGQGANNSLSQFYKNQDDWADSVPKMVQAQRVQNYFLPQKGGMAAGVVNTVNPQNASNSSLQSFYDAPSSNANNSAPNFSAMSSGEIVNNASDGINATPGQLAKGLYQQGYEQMLLGGGGGDRLMTAAIDLDPRLSYQKSFNTSRGSAEGALPSELTKINQSARVRPYQQPVFADGKLYNITTNEYNAASGAPIQNVILPNERGNGAFQTPVTNAVPGSAKSEAEARGKDIADADKAQAVFDSRIQNVLSIINEMKNLAPKTYSGYTGQGANLLAQENIPLISKMANAGTADNVSQGKFEKYNANLFTQELPAIVEASGGRLDIALLQAIKSASQIEAYAPPDVKAANLAQLETLMKQAWQNTRNLPKASRGEDVFNTQGFKIERLK